MNKKALNTIIAGLLIISLIGFTSCEKMEVSKVIGFIQGHAFDGNTSSPLDSVSVSWFVAGKKDSSVASVKDGYLIRDLPSGNYSIWCSKPNYTKVVVDMNIPLENNPQSVRGGSNSEYVLTYNPNLYPLNAKLTGRLYRTENGVNIPVAGATAVLDYNGNYSSSYDSYRFVPSVYTAITDAQGYYAFDKVPATNVLIKFNDFTDANGETYYDNSSHGTPSRNLVLQAGKSYSFGAVSLTRSVDGIQLTNSNTYISAGVGTTQFAVASDITLTFNKAVDQAATLSRGYVRLRLGGIDVASTLTFNGNTITINPDANLGPNTAYVVSYSVYSALTYDVATSTVSFSTADDAVIPAAVTNFAINMGAGWTADYNTSAVTFIFDRLANVTSYEIYAKDSYSNPEYVLISTINPNDYQQGPISATATLPAAFDYYSNDALQTPFSHGTTVSYKIRAKNSAGTGPFSTDINIKDQTPFDAADMVLGPRNGTANNSAGAAPITFTAQLTISASQYTDVATIPTFAVYTAANVLVPAATFSFVWTNHQQGVVTVTVPAGADYSVNFLRVYGVKDSSGNIMLPAVFDVLALN